MAINTSKTYLLRADGNTTLSITDGSPNAVELVKNGKSFIIPKSFGWFGDVNNIPELRGDKEMLDATSLSDTQVVQIDGIFGASVLQFEVNLPKSTDLDTLENETDNGKEYYWLVYISQLGRGYVWKGNMSFTPSEFGVNGVAHGTVTTGNESGVWYVGQTPYGDHGAVEGDKNATIALTGSGIKSGVTLTATTYSATTPNN